MAGLHAAIEQKLLTSLASQPVDLDELSAATSICEEIVNTSTADDGEGCKKRLKGAVVSLWAALGQGARVKDPQLRARLRTLCALVLEKTVTCTSPSDKNTVEVARAFLRSGREWLDAGVPGKAIDFFSRASHLLGSGTGLTERGLALLAECRSLTVQAMWRKGDREGALRFAREAEGMWGTHREATAEVVYEVAEGAYTEHEYADCLEWCKLALSGGVEGKTAARFLRMQGHALCILGEPHTALEAIDKANKLHPEGVGYYLRTQCLLSVDTAAALEEIPRLLTHPHFTPRMAVALSQSLAQRGLHGEGERLLEAMRERELDESERREVTTHLFDLLLGAAPDAASAEDYIARSDRAYTLVGELEAMEGPDAERLGKHVSAVAYYVAHHLLHVYSRPDEAMKWGIATLRTLTDAAHEERVRVHRLLSAAHRLKGALSLALEEVKKAGELEKANNAPSLPTLYQLFELHVEVGDVSSASERLTEMAVLDDAAVGSAAACCAKLAFEHDLRTLAAKALAIAATDTTPPKERLQLLANALLCGDEERVVRDALKAIRELDEGVDDEVTWWLPHAEHLAREKRTAEMYGICAEMCSLASPRDEGRRCMYLMLHASSLLDLDGEREAAEVLEQAAEAVGSLESMPIDGVPLPRLRSALDLLRVKAAVAGGNEAEVVKMIESLSFTNPKDYEAVAQMLSPGLGHHMKTAFKTAVLRAIQSAWPNKEAQDTEVKQLAMLLRRALVDADGRADQWELLDKAREAVEQWPTEYPQSELEWVVAECWNNGIYYIRLDCHERAEGWMAAAHALSQYLPSCTLRSEVTTQFDIALAQLHDSRN